MLLSNVVIKENYVKRTIKYKISMSCQDNIENAVKTVERSIYKLR